MNAVMVACDSRPYLGGCRERVGGATDRYDLRPASWMVLVMAGSKRRHEVSVGRQPVVAPAVDSPACLVGTVPVGVGFRCHAGSCYAAEPPEAESVLAVMCGASVGCGRCCRSRQRLDARCQGDSALCDDRHHSGVHSGRSSLALTLPTRLLPLAPVHRKRGRLRDRFAVRSSKFTVRSLKLTVLNKQPTDTSIPL